MGELRNIAGKKNCNGDNGVNTGKLGCTVDLSTPEHLIKMPKSMVIPQSTDFNLAYVVEQIQLGKFTPIMGSSAFEETSSEDAYNTNSSGEKRLNLPGLPEYKLTFEEGHEFYRQLSKIGGYKDSRFIIIDDQGNIAIAVNAAGDFKGFEAGHVTPEMRKTKVKGGDSEMKSLLVQFLDRLEWDENYEIILNEELDFNPSDIPSVNGVDIAITAVPQVGDTDVLIQAVLSSDRVTKAEGLDANIAIEVGGAIVGSATVTETTAGNYTVTVPALTLGQTVSIYTWDSTLSVRIAYVGTILYRSVNADTVVIA